jgi:hypothetical protein
VRYTAPCALLSAVRGGLRSVVCSDGLRSAVCGLRSLRCACAVCVCAVPASAVWLRSWSRGRCRCVLLYAAALPAKLAICVGAQKNPLGPRKQKWRHVRTTSWLVACPMCRVPCPDRTKDERRKTKDERSTATRNTNSQHSQQRERPRSIAIVYCL